MIQLNQLIEREDIELEHSIDNRRTELEAELGLSDLQIQIDTKRSEALRDEKRKDTDLEMEEQLNRLKLAEEAQALTEKKRKSEHERDIESKKIESQLEIDKLKIQGGMTAEQLMVSNPNISREAAEAMAKKFEAEAIAKANDTRAEDAKNQAEQMKDFMESQNKNLVDIVKSVTGAKSESASSNANTESARPNHIFCHECAEQIPKEYKFCPHCRAEV
jgi:membrane protein involved in colicin uptake